MKKAVNPPMVHLFVIIYFFEIENNSKKYVCLYNKGLERVNILVPFTEISVFVLVANHVPNGVEGSQ